MCELVIGKPIIKNNPKSCYQLTINYMHGDADAYSKETYTFKDPHAGEFSLVTLLKVIKLGQQIDCDFFYSSKARKESLKNAGFSQHVIDHTTDYMVGDCTNDGNTFAMFEDYDLVYFDENGIEHEVEVKL